MTTYYTVPSDEQEVASPTFKARKSSSVLASAMLTICIICFVIQTELTQYVQKNTDYSKPYFILYISHTCYILMIPLQLAAQYIQYNNNSQSSFKERLVETFHNSIQSFQLSLSELQYRVQGHDTTNSPLWFILKTSLTLAILLTLPSYIWYLSVNLTSMSNLTAIYNTGCFFAYLFSILMLHDKIRAAKVGAVLLCLAGVLTMATDQHHHQQPTNNNTTVASGWVGIGVATLGASLYGFYEVYYKKYASPSHPTILFANGITGIIGIVTCLLLWIPFPLLHFSGLEVFELPDPTTFGYILAIASMSVIYNATFMAVIALVNPVFAAVGVMLTIPAVAVTDVLVTGNMVSLSTVFGSLFILVGFVILNRQVVQEEKLDQELESQ